MTKQIREYLEHLRLFLDGEHSREEYVQEMKRLHVRIGFFSHERLVHMFIMLAFAIFFLMTLFMALIQGSIGIYVLALLFLERFQDIGNRFNPGLIEDTGITGFFPILIGQTKRVAE